MTSVTFPTALGGNGLTYTDDADALTGLADGGYRARFNPTLSNAVAMARKAYDSAVKALRENALINSSMECWNEATYAGDTYSVDTRTYRAECWYVLPRGAGAMAGRGTTIHPNALARQSFQVGGAANVTTVIVGQRVEAMIACQLKGIVTFQAWVYNGSGASFQPSLLLGTPAAVDDFATVTNKLTQQLQVCPDATWTQVHHSVDISGYANLGNGLQVEFQFPNGSMLAGDTNYFMEPMLFLGGEVTEFEIEPLTETWAKCERFYEKSLKPEMAYSSGINSGESIFRAQQAGANANGSDRIQFRSTKHHTPTITLINPYLGAGNTEVYDETISTTLTGTSAVAPSIFGFRVGCTAHASTSKNNVLGIHWLANARL